jgi:hypothetical protein
MAETTVADIPVLNESVLGTDVGTMTVAALYKDFFVCKSVHFKRTLEAQYDSSINADSLLKEYRKNPIVDEVNIDTIDVVVICIVLVILIRALTIIALKRGFSFSKGNVVFHVGEKKKTRKRTKTKSKTENSD